MVSTADGVYDVESKILRARLMSYACSRRCRLWHIIQSETWYETRYSGNWNLARNVVMPFTNSGTYLHRHVRCCDLQRRGNLPVLQPEKLSFLFAKIFFLNSVVW